MACLAYIARRNVVWRLTNRTDIIVALNATARDAAVVNSRSNPRCRRVTGVALRCGFYVASTFTARDSSIVATRTNTDYLAMVYTGRRAP